MKPGRRTRRKTATAAAVTWEQARRVLSRHSLRLLRRVGVVGVDLGIKRTAGELVPGPCIRIHVEKKLAEDALQANRRFPRKLGGVPVDVVESRFAVRMGCPDEALAHRVFAVPLLGGVSVGRFGESTFGTLGAIVVTGDGTLGGLTCAHVCEAGDLVFQPHEVGARIGTVTTDVLDSTADAALIAFDSDRASSPAVFAFGAVSNLPRDVVPEELPLAVDLVGACSGHTRGLVVATEFQGVIDYPDGARVVRGQLCIEPAEDRVFARQGDSGAGVLAGDRFVGLLIAAGPEELGGTGVATPMSRVLEKLGVALA
jgi:hypothetical protein